MFTGLVRGVGTVRTVSTRAQGRELEIACPFLADADRILGASVAVSGVCLTVTRTGAGGFAAEAAFETLAKTTLGDFAAGRAVNIEPSLRIGDPLGGHLVSGHVDGVGRLRQRAPRGEAVQLWFDVPVELRPYVAVKGSICVDGVSLTVNEVDDAGFSVGIIPHTLGATTLGALDGGAAVNLEVDLLARYVARLLECGAPIGRPTHGPTPGLTRELLADAGYLGPNELRGEST